MTRVRVHMAIAVAMVAAGFSTTARADEWNKKTTVEISAPLEIPGTVLQPGKYVFRTLDIPQRGPEAHVVQIMNDKEDKLIATVKAINNERIQPTGKTVLSFYEMPAGQPEMLRAWFYPGDKFGQEFVYPKKRAEEASRIINQKILSEPETKEPK